MLVPLGGRHRGLLIAIYHASVKTVSRKQGHSSTAAAAYRAGLVIFDDMTGVQHDYTRRKGVAGNFFLAPAHAPAWASDPAKLWNAAEAAEKRKDSTVAREFEIALPHEFSDGQRHNLVADIAQQLVDRYGFALQASTHAPHGIGASDKNYHVHILATTRRMGPEGLTEKTRELDGHLHGKLEVEWFRQMVAERTNHHLTLAGAEDRVDHRTLKAQAQEASEEGDYTRAILLTRTPTKHLGKAVTARTRRGEVSDRARMHQDIKRGNRILLSEYLERAEHEGRLLTEPASHSHPAALGERDREREAAWSKLAAFQQQISHPDTTTENDNIFQGGAVDPRSRSVVKDSGPDLDELMGKVFDDDAIPAPRVRKEIVPPDPKPEIMPPDPDRKRKEILPTEPKPEIEPPRGGVGRTRMSKGKQSSGHGPAPSAGIKLSTQGGRITRATGKDAEVLNAQASAIEEWLAHQLQASRDYLRALQSIGAVPSIPFMDAVEAMNIHRVAAYWRHPMLREDIGHLAGITNDYIHAATRLDRRQADADQAKQHLEVVRERVERELQEHPKLDRKATRKEIKVWEKWRNGLQAMLSEASEGYRKKARLLVDKAKRHYAKETDAACIEMIEETQRVEAKYAFPIPPEMEDEMDSYHFPPRPVDKQPHGPRPKPGPGHHPQLRPPRL